VSGPRELETPHPPATAEFGAVTAGGPAHRYPAAGGVEVVKFSVGPWDNNVYVITDGDEALIVDAAAEPERILREIGDARVVAIVETHDHPDHVQALPALVEALGAPVLAHPADRMPVPAEPLTGGETLRVGGAEVRVLHTPGHTPGSLSYLLDGRQIFTGDTLFPAGPGNTDGDRGRFERIMASLDQLFRLPDATRVSPGHGLDTTIGRERPYVQTWRRRGW
jgi:glyoxylase-like metal-dependent hydrolase (beta-lactamase superfamily II)